MKQILFIFIFCFCTVIFSQTVTSDKPVFWDQVQFGGGLNLNFSNQNTIIGISPSALYRFSDQFATGVSISYLYAKNKNNTYPLNIYGTSILTRYQPIEYLQLITEFEQNFLKQGNVKTQIPALYLGAGYNINSNIGFGLRYNVLYDSNNSIYPSAISPFIKVYF